MSREKIAVDTSPGAAPVRPRLRFMVWGVELTLVVLIAYQIAQLTVAALDSDQISSVTDYSAPAGAASNDVDMGRLVSFDPFFRTLETAAPTPSGQVVPESSLRIEVFGLRTVGNGEGSAIVKMQNTQQKLVQVGDRLAPSIELVGVFADRLEISRGGVREAVYLRPQAERTSVPVSAQVPASAEDITPPSDTQAGMILAQVKALQMSPVRRDRRIIGFRLPEALPPSAQLMGLEGEDILLSVNGEPLTSFERLTEIEEELGTAASLTLEIERRGEVRRLSLGLRGN